MPPKSTSALTLGLIGCGLWGRNILRDLRALGHQVRVVEPVRSDTGPTNQPGVEWFSDLADLPKVDGLIVATPASTHRAVLASLASRKVPVLCEKPLTTSAEEARKLVEQFGNDLFVGHIWCYHAGIEMLAEIAHSEELGPVHGVKSYRCNWTSPRTDVDSSWNLAPHDLAIAQYILGELPKPRAAQAEMLDGRCVGMTALLGSSPWVSFEVSNRYAARRRDVRLHCRDGVAVLPDANSPHVEISHAASDGSATTELRPVDQTSALERELSAFCQYLRGGDRPRTTGLQGLEVVTAIEALRKLAGIQDA